MEKRTSPRFRAAFELQVSSGISKGTGILVDISYSGARIESASITPKPGTHVRLSLGPEGSGFDITGKVVRAEGSGFAIAYQVEDPEVRRLVDDVAAVV